MIFEWVRQSQDHLLVFLILWTDFWVLVTGIVTKLVNS